MKVVYTKHSVRKFKYLKELGWKIKRSDVLKGLKDPIKTEAGYSNAKTALCPLSTTHNLRIVYTKKNDTITVITFYPVAKGRYDKK